MKVFDIKDKQSGKKINKIVDDIEDIGKVQLDIHSKLKE